MERIIKTLEKHPKLVETIKRHPKLKQLLAGLTIAYHVHFGKPVLREVYVDHCAIDDGKGQLWRRGWCSPEVADQMGWDVTAERYRRV